MHGCRLGPLSEARGNSTKGLIRIQINRTQLDPPSVENKPHDSTNQLVTLLLDDLFSNDLQREGLAVRSLDNYPIDARLQRFNMFLLPWDERGSQNQEACDIALMHRWEIFLPYFCRLHSWQQGCHVLRFQIFQIQ